MARILSKSQSFNLYVGNAPATGLAPLGQKVSGLQLHRLTSIGGPEWSYERQPINFIGKLAAPYKDTTDSPTVTMPFSYYIVDFENEKNLGFVIDNTKANGCVGTILQKQTDEKNYFVLVAPEGQDAIGLSGGSTGVKVIGVGNGVISSYSVEASVGDYPRANVTIEGLNVRGYENAAFFTTPAINPETGLQITQESRNDVVIPLGTDGATAKNFVLRPGDITLDLSQTSGVLTTPSSLNIQSFNISFDLAREPIQKLGSRYSVTRDITFPIDINFTVEALGGDVKNSNLNDFLCATGTQEATITMKAPSCNNNGQGLVSFVLRGLTLQSEAFSVDANANQTVSITWLGQIGGPTDNVNNLFMSGVSSY